MKIKMVSYFVGNDQKYLIYTNICSELNKKYCDLYDYEYQIDYIDKQVVTDYFGMDYPGNVIFYKNKFIKDQLDKQDCDYLVFIDADAAVSKPTIKIEDLIDNQHELFLSRGNDKIQHIHSLITSYQKIQDMLKRSQTEQKYLEKHNYDEILKEYDLYADFERLSIGYILFNEGLYVIKNTERTRKFFEEACFIQNNYFYDTYPKTEITLEGRSVGIMLMQQRYKNIYTYMFDQAQGGVANSYETRYDVEKTFVIHNYGQALNLDQKIDYVESLKTNKWWKDILK